MTTICMQHIEPILILISVGLVANGSINGTLSVMDFNSERFPYIEYGGTFSWDVTGYLIALNVQGTNHESWGSVLIYSRDVLLALTICTWLLALVLILSSWQRRNTAVGTTRAIMKVLSMFTGHSDSKGLQVTSRV